MTQLVYNRHRLTTPLKRVSGEKGSPDSQFSPISWDEALTTIAQKFLALRDAGEARAIANRTSGRLPRGPGSLVNRFFTLLGSPNDYCKGRFTGFRSPPNAWQSVSDLSDKS